MYTFGDVQEPLDSAAELLAKFLAAQMKTAYSYALASRKLHNENTEKNVRVIEVVFPYNLRLDLLHRIHKRLATRREGKKALADAKVVEGTRGEQRPKILVELEESYKLMNREAVTCANYLDSVNKARLVTLDLRTKNMAKEEYLHFHKARLISFVSSSAAKSVFKDWISKKFVLNMTLEAIEIFSMIAYETVAKIIEVAVEHRQKQPLRSAPQFCKPKLRNPLFMNAEELVPQSQLKWSQEHGLNTEDISYAYDLLTRNSEPLPKELPQLSSTALI